MLSNFKNVEMQPPYSCPQVCIMGQPEASTFPVNTDTMCWKTHPGGDWFVNKTGLPGGPSLKWVPGSVLGSKSGKCDTDITHTNLVSIINPKGSVAEGIVRNSQSELVWPILGSCQDVAHRQRRSG
ncbi:hypothetical protein BsWGS_27953 [Bradybaena similaris]